jgi:predicted Na+-dependent transporter
MLAMVMSQRPADVMAPLRNARLVIMVLAVNFVLALERNGIRALHSRIQR